MAVGVKGRWHFVMPYGILYWEFRLAILDTTDFYLEIMAILIIQLIKQTTELLQLVITVTITNDIFWHLFLYARAFLTDKLYLRKLLDILHGPYYHLCMSWRILMVNIVFFLIFTVSWTILPFLFEFHVIS